jgi:beta-phosphoglucomutase
MDSEPAHFAGFAEVVRPLGIELDQEIYAERYLGLDDYDGLAAIASDNGIELPVERIEEIVAEKTAYLKKHIAESMPPIPGTVEFIRAAASAGVPLAICSGALRDEVLLGVETLGIADCFGVIVAALDVTNGKPHPEGYLAAAGQLGEKLDRPISPDRCVAIEDSPTGIASAKAAGMKICALTTSYQPEDLTEADLVIASLNDITLADLQNLIDE